jgi:hypothetical protein
MIDENVWDGEGGMVCNLHTCCVVFVLGRLVERYLILLALIDECITSGEMV